MGTNYYLHQKPPCECCGRSYEPLHIGKSSAGWCFALHVYPEMGIRTLDDWRALWTVPGTSITNEYGTPISIAEIEAIITVRQGKMHRELIMDILARDEAMPGPNELLRHTGSHCIGYGGGTWDYITGDFS